MITVRRVPSQHMPGYYLALESSSEVNPYELVKQKVISAIGISMVLQYTGGCAGFGEVTNHFQSTIGEVTISSDHPTDFTVISESFELLTRFEVAIKDDPSFTWRD